MPREFDRVGTDPAAAFEHVFAAVPLEFGRFPKMFVVDVEPLISKLVKPSYGKQLLFLVSLLRDILVAPIAPHVIQCYLIAHAPSKILTRL